MPNNLKLHHKLLPVLIVPICFFLFVSFGWSAYSTITERGGLNGNRYIYYDVSQLQFSLYTGLISLIGLFFIILIALNIIQKNDIRMNKTFWWFIIFIGLFILCSFFLQSRFVGKG
jgi:magnesium-transporting ATPase (P-type)